MAEIAPPLSKWNTLCGASASLNPKGNGATTYPLRESPGLQEYTGMEDESLPFDSILRAKEERWAKKLAMAKFLKSKGLADTAALAVLTLRMPAHMRTSGRYVDASLSLHASFARKLREKGVSLLREEFMVGGDGPESYFAASIDPIGLKRLAVEWEAGHPWGDLADLDIMDARGNPVGRAELGYPFRTCLVCGEDAGVCITGRRHKAELIEARVDEILSRVDAPGAGDVETVGRLALTALLYEVSAAPKPGLVYPDSRGAHTDMDYLTFLSSGAALGPWFTEFARLGYRHRGEASDLLPVLRKAGIAAEQDMFAATGGVNTHKGLIFSMGLLCAAAGRLLAAGRSPGPRSCAESAAEIAKGIGASDFGRRETPGLGQTETTGERLFREYGVRGIRGEAEDGFPSVILLALPRLRKRLEEGMSWNNAMVDTLLTLCTRVEDTNVLGRAGRGGLDFLRTTAGHVLGLGGLATEAGKAAARDMDVSLIRRNISPGGCADLLALTVFLQLLASAFVPEENE